MISIFVFLNWEKTKLSQANAKQMNIFLFNSWKILKKLAEWDIVLNQFTAGSTERYGKKNKNFETEL